MEMTENQVIGLQALVGALSASQQPAGQMVDLGGGYKAFVKTPWEARMGNVLAGGSGAGAQAALGEYFRKRQLADREDQASKDFARRLDFLDKEQGYREANAQSDWSRREASADTDQTRRMGELDYRFGLGEQSAEADQARAMARMDREFSLRQQGADADQSRQFDQLDYRSALDERSADSAQARRLALMDREGSDKVSEALTAAGIAPSAFGENRARGLDALAKDYAADKRVDRAVRRADGIARLMDMKIPLEQAQAIIDGNSVAASGQAGANPDSARTLQLKAVGARQDKMLSRIDAMKRQQLDRALPSGMNTLGFYTP